jgi:phosphatidylglycerol:prolipoprotein diacylglycerol transferase
VHGIAFEIGGLQIYWYGILTAAGFLLAFWTAGRRAPRGGIPPEFVGDLAPWLIGGAVVGARLLYVISYWKEEFANAPFTEIFMLRRSGLVYYGGLIGASLATIGFAFWTKRPLWKVADVIAPSIALGHAFGRIGCLMTGCCYGRACDLPWAIHFPKDHWTGGIGVHPTQIYESILNLGLYSGLAWLFRSKRFDGQVFAVYLIAYAVLRAFVELFRGDYPVRYLGGMVTPAQLVSAAILLAGIVLYWILAGRKNTTVPPKAPLAVNGGS